MFLIFISFVKNKKKYQRNIIFAEKLYNKNDSGVVKIHKK